MRLLLVLVPTAAFAAGAQRETVFDGRASGSFPAVPVAAPAPAPARQTPAPATAEPEDLRFWIEVEAKDKFQRTAVHSAGVVLEDIQADHVKGIADPDAVRVLKKKRIKIRKVTPLSRIMTQDFPPKDAAYHNYGELEAALLDLAADHPDVATLSSMGKSVEGRELYVLRLSADASEKPGALFIGTHHAREHLSTEVPLLLAKHLAANKAKPEIRKLLASREVFIVPMLNPDGVEHDIATGKYRWQRKNMRRNENGTIGVDLNRNYDFRWGGEGASDTPSSDIYHGPAAFSEPETQAVRSFLDAHPKVKVLLSYHTFSELVLYPWGGSYDPVPDAVDQRAFKRMAETMAQWNGYKPQQSSDLYIATGDTCDWAYQAKGIFAFTFELTPRSGWEGGFYPGAGVIQSTFEKNLQPALYLIDLADDPRRAADPA